MSVQLGINAKVFLTTNLSSTGAVLDSGFTSDNTTEITIVRDSLSFSQTKQFSYINNHTAIDTTSYLETRANPTKSLGSLSFVTSLNSSSTGPFDAILWNALVNNMRYPLSVWTIGEANHTMKIIRQVSGTIAIGIIIQVDDVAYIFDSVRVDNLSLGLEIDQISTATWTCSFTSYRVVPATYTQSGNTYTLSGTLSGTAKVLDQSVYSWGSNRLSRISIAKAGGLDPVSLAGLELGLSVANNHTYLEDLGIDRTSLSNIYTDAGAASLAGRVRVYSRGVGNSTYTFTQELRNQLSDPYSTQIYELTIEIFSNTQSKLCDIQLYSCSLETITETNTEFTDIYNYKVVEGLEAKNCFIKFYT